MYKKMKNLTGMLKHNNVNQSKWKNTDYNNKNVIDKILGEIEELEAVIDPKKLPKRHNIDINDSRINDLGINNSTKKGSIDSLHHIEHGSSVELNDYVKNENSKQNIIHLNENNNDRKLNFTENYLNNSKSNFKD